MKDTSQNLELPKEVKIERELPDDVHSTKENFHEANAHYFGEQEANKIDAIVNQE